jgi:hypothetical protein
MNSTDGTTVLVRSRKGPMVLATAVSLRPYHARWDNRIYQAPRPRLENTQ